MPPLLLSTSTVVENNAHKKTSIFSKTLGTIDSTLFSVLVSEKLSLRNGVVKLEDTRHIVKGLKQELIQLQPLLQSKATEAEGLLRQVRGITVAPVSG